MLNHRRREPVLRDPKNALQELTTRVLCGNGENFEHMARSIRVSLWTSYGMNVVLFGVGVVGFIAALSQGLGADGEQQVTTTAIFGGLSAVSFVTAFVTRPVDTVARQSIYASWLYAVINTYWTRLVYFDDPSTVDRDLVAAESDLVERLLELATTHSANPVRPKPKSRPIGDPSPLPQGDDVADDDNLLLETPYARTSNGGGIDR